MMKIVETVLAPVSVIRGDGIYDLKSVYETHFAGQYDHLFKVFFVALKHNYASFFSGLPGVIQTILPKKS